MPGVLEIEQTEIKQEENQDSKIASWLVEIPSNVIAELGLADGSKVALTIKNGEVSGDILPPLSDELENIANEILKKRRKLYEELRRAGD